MEIRISENVKKEKVINVDFPVFREHYLGDSTIYTKVVSMSKEINIHIYQDGTQRIQCEIEQPSTYSSEDYFTGKGEFKSSETNFEKALTKFTNQLK